jgi:hypothetical protein
VQFKVRQSFEEAETVKGAYVLNLLFSIPFLSDLLRPLFYNKESIEDFLSPFYFLWTFLVGTYSIVCFLSRVKTI